MALKKFPGFIDVHTHLREPGATHKEDFRTASRAAIKGGFTFIADMPNNPIPTTSYQRLKQKISLADKKAVCDIGFYFGATNKNFKAFNRAWKEPRVLGLKIYCNQTTGDLLVNDLKPLEAIFKSWQTDKPILVHAEGAELALAIGLADLYDKKIHICHLSKAIEVKLVKQAKLRKQKITAGVCPHHLFLTNKDVKSMGGYAKMKPELGSKKDQEELWEALRGGVIDLVESDHAPHTKEEKEKDPPAFGVPGLETTVGLLFLAVKEKKLKEDQIINLLYYNPRKIFNIPKQPKTYTEIDLNKSYLAGEGGYETKCGWSPFDGWELNGKIEKVVFRGRALYASSSFL